jgi:hypothetical protein
MKMVLSGLSDDMNFFIVVSSAALVEHSEMYGEESDDYNVLKGLIQSKIHRLM